MIHCIICILYAQHQCQLPTVDENINSHSEKLAFETEQYDPWTIIPACKLLLHKIITLLEKSRRAVQLLSWWQYQIIDEQVDVQYFAVCTHVTTSTVKYNILYKIRNRPLPDKIYSTYAKLFENIWF